MSSYQISEQIQKKTADLQKLYRRNNWPDQWLYDILREFHIWSIYSLRHGGNYQIPEQMKSWFDRIFSGHLIRIGRLEFDLQGHFGGRIRVFQKGSEISILAESGLIFDDRGYRSGKGWKSTLAETEDGWLGNPIFSGLAEHRTVFLRRQEWTPVLAYNDPVLEIHIPEDGPMNMTDCLHSLQEAVRWFGNDQYHWKGFSCQSWFLDPKFTEMLGKDSNIVQFQRLGRLYPLGIESRIEERVYPGKLLHQIREEQQKGHVFMSGGMFLLKKELTPLFRFKQGKDQ